jgi:hypothetical protein
MEDLELVVLFADLDAQRFVTRLIERGVEQRCLRSMSWKGVRDPMHDARVAGEPTAALAPFLRHPTCRFVVVLDHHGSGGESRSRESLESDVAQILERAGVARDRTEVIAFEPELEAALVPVWSSVLELLARKRGALCAALDANARDPKTSWERALRAYQLKSSSALFGELATSLSLSTLKNGSALGRLAACLVRWFGREGVG